MRPHIPRRNVSARIELLERVWIERDVTVSETPANKCRITKELSLSLLPAPEAATIERWCTF